jgi:hypothetical protein
MKRLLLFAAALSSAGAKQRIAHPRISRKPLVTEGEGAKAFAIV